MQSMKLFTFVISSNLKYYFYLNVLFVFLQQNYLMEFGYLPKSDIETGNLRTEEQLKEAIKTLQRFGHIPATGAIDNATHALMLRPRCGQPDNPDSADFTATNRLRGRRAKRFAIQGSKWPTTSITWR